MGEFSESSRVIHKKLKHKNSIFSALTCALQAAAARTRATRSRRRPLTQSWRRRSASGPAAKTPASIPSLHHRRTPRRQRRRRRCCSTRTTRRKRLDRSWRRWRGRENRQTARDQCYKNTFRYNDAPLQCDQKKNCQMSIKVPQKLFHYKNDRFLHLYKKCLRMWAIWAN